MTLTTQPRYNRRFIFTQCAMAADSPLTEQEKQDVLDKINGNQNWAPTPQDTPVSFGKVEAWHAQQQAGRRVRHG